MFSDEILNEIFARTDVAQVPLCYQSIMVSAISEVLDANDNKGSKRRRSEHTEDD